MTVAEMLARMSGRELAEWIEFYRIQREEESAADKAIADGMKRKG